jgi:hypothetical protein
MPWVRIDENAMDHPKVAGLSAESFRLWVQGLAYCQKFLTDGVIKSVQIRGLRSHSPKRVEELILAGLWEATDEGIQVHDYLQWNDSKAHVLHVREMARERIRRLRGKGKPDVRNAVTAGVQTEYEPRSYSGGCVSLVSSSSKVKEEGAGETKSLTERASEFCEWYADEHATILGVGYLGSPQNDYRRAQDLCRIFTDGEIRDAAIVWFGQTDAFATNGTRTITKFASRASDLVKRARRVTA